MQPQSINRMWPSREAFLASIDDGIKVVTGELTNEPPCKADEPTLKSLLAVFVAATIDMDPASVTDSSVGEKLTSVRLALLAAYNLGRQHAKMP